MTSSVWRTLSRNKTLRYGAPMLLLIVGGSFGLREFTQIRYDAQKLKRKIDPALEELISKKNVSLESEFEKVKSSNLDDWRNIRGPRPWEDSKPFQDQQRASAISKDNTTKV
ncbi:cytochrome c oxidase assembly protein COX16 homolog, mitochondrial [Bombina bombina]|uniref:cytochrome c oxidase assembly protein COX16 homolog, mitochondrial n=1 Tax=Bombina bombina TaxID=8345 RepID=UPI00235A4DE0|nr:cytochrome c oxidase assembly protein COX16 homolog, mitochondrial [Bombina bombina]